MEIFDIIKVLLKRWYFLVFGPIIAIVIAFFIVKNLPDTYRSTAHLSTGFTIDEQVDLTDSRVNPRELEVKFNNLIQNLKSNDVQHFLSYRLILHDLKSSEPFVTPEKEDFSISESDKRFAIEQFQNKLDSSLILSSYKSSDKFLIDILKAYEYLPENNKENTFIKRITQTDYISIDYYSNNPYQSAFAVNALCEEFLKYNRSSKFSQTRESITFLEDLVITKRKELDAAKARLNDIKNQNQVIDYKIEGQAKVNQLENLESQKSDEVRNINGLRLSLEQVDSRIAALSKDGNNTQKSNNNQLLYLRRKIDELNERYMATNRTDKKIYDSLTYYREQYAVEGSRSQINERGAADVNEQLSTLIEEKYTIERNLRIAEANLENLTSQISNIKSNVSSFTVQESQISNIQEEINLLTDEYLSIQTRLMDMRNKALTLGSNLKQVLSGQPAEEPESSKKIIMVLLAGVLTFIMIAIIVILIDLIDQSIRSVDKYKQIIRHPLVGILNKIQFKGVDINIIFNKLDNPDYDFFTQSLRKIRFELEKTNKKIFLFTSPESGEGKTSFILNLTYSLGLINKKVLIIDTNFKSNKLSKVLRQQIKDTSLLKPGLNSEFYRNMDKKNAQLGNLVSPTPNKNIWFIACENSPNSPFEILDSIRFREFLQQCTQQFDYIFMEGPALNKYSDTKELIEFADKVVGIFSAYRTVNKLDKETNDYLSGLNGQYLGYVLNKMERSDILN